MHEDITMFQETWEQTYEEQGEPSLLDITRYFLRHEDIDMGWINVNWGVPQVPNVSTSLPHKVSFALDEVVE